MIVIIMTLAGFNMQLRVANPDRYPPAWSLLCAVFRTSA